MAQAIDHKLRVGFRTLFPQYAKELDAAKSQAEINTLHSRFVLECQQKLEAALAKSNLAGQETDQTACIPLSSETYETLIHATGDTIKNQLHVLLDGLERLKGMEDDDAGLVTAQIILSGALGVGLLSTSTVVVKLATGAVEAVAAFAGVEAATVGVVCAVVALVIVAVLIPIIYYMEKPALTIALLINELDKPLVFQDQYNVHGKPTLITTPIPNGVVIPDVGTYAVAGFIASQKRDEALVGTQYGFTMKYDNVTLAYGMDCPLTGIYKDNNCYCAFGETAQTAAEKTDKSNVQYSEARQGNLNLSIRCNSGSGSIAYYVARAYFA